MYKLKTSASFDSAHFLKDYDGKCSNIHGHRWTVEIVVGSEILQQDDQNRGMVVDFTQLKKDLKEIVDYFDHSLIIEVDSLKATTVQALESEKLRLVRTEFRPTAENFAKWMYGAMKRRGYSVVEASVYETPNNVATYCE